MLKVQIGPVDLLHLPPREAVVSSGGGRPVNERTTVAGVVIGFRSPLPESRRVTVAAPAGFVIAAADAAALLALGDGPFTLTLTGYELEGTFAGCVFERPPRFPPTSNPDYRAYDLEIYIPQGA